MSPSSNELDLARRIVTGLDDNAKARVTYDDAGGHVKVTPRRNEFQTVWLTKEFPADCSSATEEDSTGNITYFPFGGEASRCVVVWLRPDSSSPMHSTRTIHYAVVLAGEIELETENGDRTLIKTGDVVVQRGTKHAWHNKHATEWVKMFCVFIRAQNTQSG